MVDVVGVPSDERLKIMIKEFGTIDRWMGMVDLSWFGLWVDLGLPSMVLGLVLGSEMGLVYSLGSFEYM